ALPEITDPAALVRRISSAAETHDVLRVKGFVAVAGKPMRLLVQGVGARVTHQYDRPWGASEAREGRLVVIGLKGLDRAAVAQVLHGGRIHLLATPSTSLDEIVEPIDLAQPPGDVLILSFVDSDLAA